MKWLAHRSQNAAVFPRPQSLRDKVLARRLRQLFEQDLALAGLQGIHFYVQDGVVTLHGTLRHDLDRELLVSLIRKMAGTRDVVDHLQISDPLSPEIQATLSV